MNSYLRLIILGFGSGAFVLASVLVLSWLSFINSQKASTIPFLVDKITLLPSQILPENDLRLQPRTLENKTSDFDYEFGRKLQKERSNRYLTDWQKDEVLVWFTEPLTEGEYKLTLQYKSDFETEISLTAFGESFLLKAPKCEDWKQINKVFHIKTSGQKNLALKHFAASMSLKDLVVKRI